MTADIEAARERAGDVLKTRKGPGRMTIEADGDEVTVTISEIPFTQHGMQFKSAVRLHFTLELGEDGTFRTYWGKHDWAGEGADRGPCKTVKASETHGGLEPALAWIAEKIAAHAK